MNLMSLQKLVKMPVHPLCKAYPDIEGEVWKRMVADVRAHGIANPVLLWKGQVVDGKNRLRAAVAAGLAPDATLPIKPVAATEEELPLHILRHNELRRHQNPGQRAMAAADVATTDARGGRPGNLAAGSYVSKAEAAEAAGVPERAVQDARAIQRDADPSVAQAVRDGDATLKDATRVKDLPHAAQRAAVAEVKAGTARTLTTADATQTGIDFDAPAEGTSAKAKAAPNPPPIPLKQIKQGDSPGHGMRVLKVMERVDMDPATNIDRNQDQGVFAHKWGPPGTVRKMEGRVWLQLGTGTRHWEEAVLSDALDCVESGAATVLMVDLDGDATEVKVKTPAGKTVIQGRPQVARLLRLAKAVAWPTDTADVSLSVLCGTGEGMDGYVERFREHMGPHGPVVVAAASSEEDEEESR